MKVNCPRCSQPFLLSEERIVSEALRIRCSSCGAVFRIKGKKRVEQTETGDLPAYELPPAPAPTPAPVPAKKPVAWFAVVGGNRIGPFGEKALGELVAKGKVSAETPLWKKGMGAWSRGAEIAELAPLFAAAPAAAEQTSPEAPAGPATVASTEKVVGAQASAPKPRPAAKAEPEPAGHDFDGWGEAPAKSKTTTEDSTEAFFKMGEPHPVLHYDREIELSETALETVDLRDESVHKGARETLRDFSVMARLSTRSRRRSIGVVIGLAIACIAAMSVVFIFGEAVEFTGKQRELVWEGADSGNGNGVQGNGGAARRRVNQELKTPLRPKDEKIENLPELEQDLSKELTVETGVGVDKDRLKRRLAGEEEAESEDLGEGDEMVITAGSEEEGREDEGAGSRRAAEDRSGRSDKKGKQAVSAFGSSSDFLTRGKVQEQRLEASVKERKSDGKLWKIILQNNVVRKINAERKQIQGCATSAGVSSGVRVILGIRMDGTVGTIEASEGGPPFEACLGKMLASWKAGRQLPSPVKLPVKLQFE